ncbi:hypothetical protein [Tenacibaculum finnmarkense]|uniref:hypothetical protein n=1 Tax=Tenacibaculum finnmarkense TaxID=2781243 RepID=UPI001E2CCEEF|nr:hypothetical protein [Tenacibaculum finnmarkense]MCD8423584.1 hypothetical protein [Tenacibaculum finnmarkense genomovar ulcerans]MCG8239793.1 hypothetical protein [Tenacibaculum finnmarkense genomovar ulcerans]
MDKIIEIKENDIVKYLKSVYLVKSFIKLENGLYHLNYYFKTNQSKIKTKKLHNNAYDEFYGYLAEKIKQTSLEEKKDFVSKINRDYPKFDTSFTRIDLKENSNSSVLNVEDCIEFLKKKNYIIYKQI